jgi:hypothetical protein
MTDAIFKLIQYHLQLLEAVDQLGQRILRAAREGDMNAVNKDADNRQRLLSVMEQIQSKSEEVLKFMTQQGDFSAVEDVIKFWAYDFNLWSEKINQIDQEIIQILSEQKDQTTQELATLFQSKEKFKGYNLNSTKK